MPIPGKQESLGVWQIGPVNSLPLDNQKESGTVFGVALGLVLTGLLLLHVGLFLFCVVRLGWASLV